MNGRRAEAKREADTERAKRWTRTRDGGGRGASMFRRERCCSERHLVVHISGACLCVFVSAVRTRRHLHALATQLGRCLASVCGFCWCRIAPHTHVSSPRAVCVCAIPHTHHTVCQMESEERESSKEAEVASAWRGAGK